MKEPFSPAKHIFELLQSKYSKKHRRTQQQQVVPFLLREQLESQGLFFEDFTQKDMLSLTAARVVQYSIDIFKKYIQEKYSESLTQFVYPYFTTKFKTQQKGLQYAMSMTLYLEYFKRQHEEINHIYHIFDEEPSLYFIKFFLRCRRIIQQFVIGDQLLRCLLEQKTIQIDNYPAVVCRIFNHLKPQQVVEIFNDDVMIVIQQRILKAKKMKKFNKSALQQQSICAEDLLTLCLQNYKQSSEAQKEQKRLKHQGEKTSSGFIERFSMVYKNPKQLKSAHSKYKKSLKKTTPKKQQQFSYSSSKKSQKSSGKKQISNVANYYKFSPQIIGGREIDQKRIKQLSKSKSKKSSKEDHFQQISLEKVASRQEMVENEITEFQAQKVKKPDNTGDLKIIQDLELQKSDLKNALTGQKQKSAQTSKQLNFVKNAYQDLHEENSNLGNFTKILKYKYLKLIESIQDQNKSKEQLLFEIEKDYIEDVLNFEVSKKPKDDFEFVLRGGEKDTSFTGLLASNGKKNFHEFEDECQNVEDFTQNQEDLSNEKKVQEK